MSSLRLGNKVRSMRRRDGMSQTQLATRLDISASYLNLIEHNQRPLTAQLLVKVAQVFKVDLASFADDSQAQLAADLQEIFGDPLFEDHPLTTGDVRELADNGAAARAIVSLYHAYRSSVESTRALAAKLYDGRDFLGVDPAHFPSEEVNDVIQSNLNYFPDLEAAAEQIVASAPLDRSDMYRSLVVYLRDKHGIEVALIPVSRDGGVIRRFDPARRLLSISEVLPPWSRNFQIAHQVGSPRSASRKRRECRSTSSASTSPETSRNGSAALGSASRDSRDRARDGTSTLRF